MGNRFPPLAGVRGWIKKNCFLSTQRAIADMLQSHSRFRKPLSRLLYTDLPGGQGFKENGMPSFSQPGCGWPPASVNLCRQAAHPGRNDKDKSPFAFFEKKSKIVNPVE